jgi:hypothetical protein
MRSTAIEIADTLALSIPPTGVTEAVVVLPEWYESYTGSVSVWTPYATCIVYGKPATGTRSTAPFMPGWPATHYVEVGEHDSIEPNPEEYRHAELAPDLLAIKPFGEPRQYYRIDFDLVAEPDGDDLETPDPDG